MLDESIKRCGKSELLDKLTLLNDMVKSKKLFLKKDIDGFTNRFIKIIDESYHNSTDNSKEKNSQKGIAVLKF